jgi:hypothetical protein
VRDEEPTTAPTTAINTLTPSIAPQDITSVPTLATERRVVVEEFYLSFVAPNATRGPTTTEYDEMTQRITNWFEIHFIDIYANVSNVEFLGMETTNDFTLYGRNNEIPPRPADFNIYMHFDNADFTFTKESAAPDSSEVIATMIASIDEKFVREIVRTDTGTPFVSTNEVFISARKTHSQP